MSFLLPFTWDKMFERQSQKTNASNAITKRREKRN